MKEKEFKKFLVEGAVKEVNKLTRSDVKALKISYNRYFPRRFFRQDICARKVGPRTLTYRINFDGTVYAIVVTG